MRILDELWPAFLPLLLYLAWFGLAQKRAAAKDAPRPRFRDGPWYWAVLASMAVAALIFILLGLAQPENRGRYQPPHLQNGVIVPGKVQP